MLVAQYRMDRWVEFVEDPVFGLQVPTECEGVPSEILMPKNTWKNKTDYDKMAASTAKKFAENFAKYNDYVNEDVRKAGPKI